MPVKKASEIILPQWPAPKNVKALCTTRKGGFSRGAYQSNNFGLHVGDDDTTVTKNRRQLLELHRLPGEPAWMSQVHSNRVLPFAEARNAEADACYSNSAGEVCVVMTADCLPVLFTDDQGTEVAAAHAGWRGLLDDILENTVNALQCPAEKMLVWLGPAIGPNAFEVGEEVKQGFMDKNPSTLSAFKDCGQGKWLADIYTLARIRLRAIGINQVYGGEYCTYSDEQRFYSYRRDNVSGRMATLIWLDNH